MEQDQQSPGLFGLNIDQPIRAHLYETAKWGRFLAIIGFIGCALLILVGIYIATAGSFMAGSESFGDTDAMAAMGPVLLIVYILIAVLYFFPCLFLLRFSNKMKLALTTDDQFQLSSGFQNLKILFRYMGILTIITLAIYLLALVGGLIASA